MLSEEEIKSALPVNLRGNVSSDFVSTVNSVVTDPEAAAVVRENFISYTHVLREGQFKLTDYLNAVAYASFKIMGLSSREAYERTFPGRYQGLVARGASNKDISAYVAAYNQNKLVNLILEHAMIPTWVLNQDAFQKAINVQVDLMLTAKSEKVRSDAANSLLTHLKKPDKAQVEVDFNIKETSGMVELKDMLTQLAEKQQNLIGQGIPTRDIAHQKLIEGTAIDVTPEDES